MGAFQADTLLRAYAKNRRSHRPRFEESAFPRANISVDAVPSDAGGAAVFRDSLPHPT